MATWQALALLAAAGGVAAWLFLMKVRPPRVQVPSLLLWQRVLDRPRDLTWWERVRRAVSLVATVLIALLLGLAVTRPEARRGLTSQGRTLIVLDSSWSMAARTSTGETRWQRALRQARTLASSANGDVALATTADGLVEGPTADTALIETALDRLNPAGGEAVAFPHVPGADHVHFITDGGVARALDDKVAVHSVYDAAPNAAIIAFGARPSPAGDSGGEAFVQVANYADQPKQVRLIVSRGASVLSDQRVDMAAGEAISQIVPLEETGGARLLARIEAADDALTEDNEAVAWLESRDEINVTLVSDDPAALQQLFSHDPSLRVTAVKPAAYAAPASGVVVFDRWLPAEVPTRPALFVAPPASSWLGQPGEIERSARWSAAGSHPVVFGVDPLTIEVKRVRGLEARDATVIARSEKGTPLISVIDRPDRRAVIWSFAPADTNLANAPGFPVLAGDAIDWLGRPSYGVRQRPGAVRLPGSTSRVLAPDGKPIPVTHAGDTAAVRLPAPGLYLVDAGGSRGVVGMNVGDPEVSNLSRSALKNDVAVVASGGAGWSWWLWAVVIAFILISIEWWTWQRRVTV